MFIFIPPLMNGIERIVLVGVRNLLTLREEDPILCAKEHHWDFIDQKNFSDISKETEQEKCMEVLLKLGKEVSVIEAEGYIVKGGDEKFSRLGIKTQNYTLLEYLKGTYALSTRIKYLCSIYCEILREEKEEAFCRLFPYWAKWCVFMTQKIDNFCKEIDEIYLSLKDLPTKEFSNKLKQLQSDNPFKAKYIFLRKKKEQSMKEILKEEAKANILKFSKILERLLSDLIDYAKIRQTE